MEPVKRKITIPAGSSWRDSFLWLSTPFIYQNVESVVRGLPTQLVVPDHGLQTGVIFPVYISNSGPLKINSEDSPSFVRVANADTLILDGIDTTNRPESTVGMKLSHMTPRNLVGATGVMQFRETIDGPVLLTLNSTEGKIIFTGAEITVSPSAADTRLLLKGGLVDVTGNAHLEITLATGETLRLVEYSWLATAEWTRT